MPARLLKVERTTDTADPIVTLTLIDQEHDYKYVALSHYWARSKPIKTTSLDVHERSAGMQWDDLPQVFQDAIRLSLRLGIRYTWIDSLCITQGDETDWLAESPKIRAIYQNAYMVFAAHGHTLALNKEEKRRTHEGIVDSIARFGDTDVMVPDLEGLGAFKNAISAQESSISAVRKKKYGLSAMKILAANVAEWPMSHKTAPVQRGIIRKRTLLALSRTRKLCNPRNAQNSYGGPIVTFVEPLHPKA